MEKARNHRTREIAGKIWRGIVWVWRHPVIPITVLLVVLTATCYKDARQRRGLKTEIDALKDTVEAMSGVIDSLECIHVLEDKVTKKAGELAIRPHGEGKKLTEENVAKLLTELDAWFPDIKMAQYQHESGFGVSKVARNANNISGMKKTGRRKTTQLKNEEYNGYGKYNDWESFVIDHVLWDYAVFGCHKPTRREYIVKLNRIYSEHGDYGETMERSSRQYRKYFNN